MSSSLTQKETERGKNKDRQRQKQTEEDTETDRGRHRDNQRQTQRQTEADTERMLCSLTLAQPPPTRQAFTHLPAVGWVHTWLPSAPKGLPRLVQIPSLRHTIIIRTTRLICASRNPLMHIYSRIRLLS